ncbi:hypothetical protein L1987_37672 [Smallanthus sonchifolius]|uniref:Uncharacterized protein n=1 Tax=Smallanthus sonchifolius TaxID=185202 RepID=A0ACB9HHX9_9ASTR|nr:hypothetical protein L1987_37672 [Smallanthus sonchifolius]
MGTICANTERVRNCNILAVGWTAWFFCSLKGSQGHCKKKCKEKKDEMNKHVNNTAKPSCPTHCGNVTVPYPFGIGTDCSLDRIFNLNCNYSYEPPKDKQRRLFSACFGLCQTPSNVRKGQCSGIGCCQIPIPKGLSYYTATLHYNECGFGLLVEEGGFEFGGATDLSSNYTEFVNRIRSNMVVVLDWVITSNGTCTSVGNE